MILKGILLPIYSIPSKYGIGEFSKEAFSFIDALKKNGFNAWQITPIQPSNDGHNPYHIQSSYGYDEMYISLDDLYSRELITKPTPYNEHRRSVNYEDVLRLKRTYYYEAFFNFVKKNGIGEIRDFGLLHPELVEYAKFAALKDINRGKPVQEWDKVDDPRINNYVNYHLFLQMVLYQEWKHIKNHAEDVGVKIITDISTIVDEDSQDYYFAKKKDEDLLLNKRFEHANKLYDIVLPYNADVAHLEKIRKQYKFDEVNIIQTSIFDDAKKKIDHKDELSYLGSHDNMSTSAFLKTLSFKERKEIKNFLAKEGINNFFVRDGLIKYLFKQERAIISYQDLLKLPNRARINDPSTNNRKNFTYKLANFNKLIKELEKLNND